MGVRGHAYKSKHIINEITASIKPVYRPPPPLPSGKIGEGFLRGGGCLYTGYKHFIKVSFEMQFFTAAGLAQSVERLTAEREVVGSIPGAGPTLRVLK